jgi:hypothetical protein
MAAIETAIGTLAIFVSLRFLVGGCGGVDVNVELYTFADTKTPPSANPFSPPRPPERREWIYRFMLSSNA